MNEKWFALSIEEIEKKLKTNAASGLSRKAARSRAEAHKKDAPFFTVKKKRLDRLLLDIMSDFFLILLVLLSCFSLFFEGDALIGGAILLLTALNVAVSLFIYFRDRRCLESMSDFFSPTARVIRGGKLYIADYRDVAEGDVILIEKGDILGCDARLIHSDRLKVRMKTDKKREVLLEKYAGGAVREDELLAENMGNMVHAGSVVESGSGRAIVVAVGKYTYLGAMTGGITEVPSSSLPEGLARLKKECSRLGIFMLLLTLPFCIFSVLFGHFPGGNVVLSEAVTVALAIGSTAMLSRTSNLFCTFFVRFMRKSAVSENPCIIRSLDAFDKLGDMDLLFLLDGSIATDGILHFEGLATADGETKSFERMGQSARQLCELIALYSMARASAPSIGIKSNGEIDIGTDEFMKKSAIDTEALKIRCTIHSYLPGIDRSARDSVSYTDGGKRREISVSLSEELLFECRRAVIAGEERPLTYEGKEAIIHSFENYISMGRCPVIFAVGDEENRCFIGMLILREGADPDLAKAVSAVRKSGVGIISFSNCKGREGAPEIPDLLRQGRRVYADDFARLGKSVTYMFGSFDEYCGLGAKEIAELAKYAKDMGKKIMICGFTDFAAEAAEYADALISCAPVRTGVFGNFDEEIRALEVPGEQSSASCTQSVRAEADILLMRPKNGKGGLSPLAYAVGYCRLAYLNLSSFLKYFIFAQLMRIFTVAAPMLLGKTNCDARHILILGFVFDFITALLFAYDGKKGAMLRKDAKKEVENFKLLNALKKNIPLLLSTALGSLLCILLPTFVGSINLFGNYIYKAEYTFTALLIMQISLLFCVYTGDLTNKERAVKLLKSKAFIAELVLSAILLPLCFLTPVGKFFGLVKNPIAYFLLSFIPAGAFLVCYFALTLPRKRKNQKRNDKNLDMKIKPRQL